MSYALTRLLALFVQVAAEEARDNNNNNNNNAWGERVRRDIPREQPHHGDGGVGGGGGGAAWDPEMAIGVARIGVSTTYSPLAHHATVSRPQA
jgi:hypothetical protein